MKDSTTRRHKSICRFYRKGYCRNGAKCRYTHPRDAENHLESHYSCTALSGTEHPVTNTGPAVVTRQWVDGIEVTFSPGAVVSEILLEEYADQSSGDTRLHNHSIEFSWHKPHAETRIIYEQSNRDAAIETMKSIVKCRFFGSWIDPMQRNLRFLPWYQDPCFLLQPLPPFCTYFDLQERLPGPSPKVIITTTNGLQMRKFYTVVAAIRAKIGTAAHIDILSGTGRLRNKASGLHSTVERKHRKP